MAVLGPFHSLAIPIIFALSLPLLGLAFFTTCLSISILAFRVLVVYAELFVAVIPYYFSPFPPSSTASLQKRPEASRSEAASNAFRRRCRTSSISLNSAVSSNSLTPVASTAQLLQKVSSTNPAAVPRLKPSVSTSAIVPPSKSGNQLALTSQFQSYLSPTTRDPRDYEGVGGWRLGDDEDADVLWTTINSRLELPAEHGRRHQRSVTGGSIKFRGEPVELGSLQPRTADREDFGLVRYGSGTRSVRSGSPEAERERVMAGGAAWEREKLEKDRERESNVGRARTPLEGSSSSTPGERGAGYFVGGLTSMSLPTSPKQSKRTQSTHTVTSTSSGSSRGSGGGGGGGVNMKHRS